MNKYNFFSKSSYVFLPTSKYPKVALAVDNSRQAHNAFKLYNPFSKKAKFFKKVVLLVYVTFNSISKFLFLTQKKEKSAFVYYLENKLGSPLVSSLYFATINDKVVMQLQTLDAEIIGYLKYPLNDIGLKHLENERKAIEILSKNKIIEPFILYDEFEGKPFLLLAALEGEIGFVEQKQLNDLLIKFKKEQYARLIYHPRVLELKRKVTAHGLSAYLPIIERLCKSSVTEYAVVYEHGDFTPWNIVKVNDDYIPFDFEHFVEDGLEYFDLIKYYYQIGKLIESLNANELVAYVSAKVNTIEVEQLLKLFLIKEIIRNTEENEECNFEIKMLKMMVR